MKGRSFETFQVTPGNREAYTVCRRIALLEEMGPALVVLLGPEGCGKSHLLWAIAKQVRAGTLPAGLALLTPDDIPEKVRSLVEDSSPLQGHRAMLLVDGLERFDTEVRRLDAVIEIFLAYQYPVVIATSVHPNRLERLSVPLVNRLTGARVVAMEPHVPEADEDTSARIQTLEEATRALQRQRDLLQDQLAASEALREEATSKAETAETRAAEAVEGAKAADTQCAEMRVALDGAMAEMAAVEARALEQHSEAEKARAAWHSVARALEELSGVKEALEAQLVDSESEAAYAMAQQARLQGELAAAREHAAVLPELRASRDEAEKALEDTAVALETMRAQYDSLCGGLASDMQAIVDDLDAMEPVRPPEGDAEARLTAALADASRAQEHLRNTLVATRERLKAVEFEWAKSRKVLTIQTAEMDALRYAAASQVAQANIQAGEVEQRIGLLETALESLRANRPEGGVDDGDQGKTWAMALENMQAQLAALRKARSDASETLGSVDEQALFGSDFFEALPTDFEGPRGGESRPSLPGLDGELREALEDALGPPASDETNAEEKDASIDLNQ